MGEGSLTKLLDAIPSPQKSLPNSCFFSMSWMAGWHWKVQPVDVVCRLWLHIGGLEPLWRGVARMWKWSNDLQGFTASPVRLSSLWKRDFQGARGWCSGETSSEFRFGYTSGCLMVEIVGTCEALKCQECSGATRPECLRFDAESTLAMCWAAFPTRLKEYRAQVMPTQAWTNCNKHKMSLPEASFGRVLLDSM